MKIQGEAQTRQCPRCGTVMEDQAVTWSNVQEELVSESAIRADEREKCRAELRAKVDRLVLRYPDEVNSFVAEIDRWANEEAFGGD